MSEVNVYVDVSQFAKMLLKYPDRAESLPMDLIAEGLMFEIAEMFETSGASGVKGQWPGLSPTTVKLHPKRQLQDRPLLDTGHLANIQVIEEGANFVEVGSPAPYAGYHVTGAWQRNIFRQHAPHELPERDFLAIDLEKVLEDAAEIVAQEIDSI